MPGYVPRQGMGPVEAIRAIRAAGGLASLAHFPEAPDHLPLLRDLVGEGLNGLESHHRSFDAAAAGRGRARSRRRSPWSRRAAPTTTGTSGRTPAATPGW